jgi:hypothetical protein
MRKEYDFSQSVKNPYVEQLKEPVTINLGVEVIEYFEKMSKDTDIPYQTLISLYLKDCVQSQRKLSLTWLS